MSSRFTVRFNDNMKPTDIYRTNQTVFDLSELSHEAYDNWKAHHKEYFFEDWTKGLQFKNALRRIGVRVHN